jgi:hypothetical protein
VVILYFNALVVEVVNCSIGIQVYNAKPPGGT